MGRRKGRPHKITYPISFTLSELKIFAKVLRKTDEIALLTKVRNEIKERQRSQRAYQKLKKKIFDGV